MQLIYVCYWQRQFLNKKKSGNAAEKNREKSRQFETTRNLFYFIFFCLDLDANGVLQDRKISSEVITSNLWSLTCPISSQASKNHPNSSTSSAVVAAAKH